LKDGAFIDDELIEIDGIGAGKGGGAGAENDGPGSGGGISTETGREGHAFWSGASLCGTAHQGHALCFAGS
jgi:hypothetical protein